MSLLIIGCGYVGKVVAKRWSADFSLRAQGTASPPRVYALTRSAETAEELTREGITGLVGHWLNRDSLPEMPQDITSVLIAVPHREDAESQLPTGSDQTHSLGLANILSRFEEQPRYASQMPRLVYLSTTGVFGSNQPGDRVSEHTPTTPTRIGPRIAVAAENWLRENQSQWPSITLRLAGIYGPGRIPLLQALRSGQSLAVQKDGLLNLIHVDDIAQAVMWSLTARTMGTLYLLSDNHPVRRELFYRYLAELNHLPQPTFVEPDGLDSRAQRSTHKLVDATLFWNESGLTPLHTDYRSGLKANLDQLK